MSQKNYLDLAGLTAYDTKIKEWFKAGVVDITEDAIRALFVTVAEGPADNEIWYTTSDGKICDVNESIYLGGGYYNYNFNSSKSGTTNIISNEYNDGIGKIVFNETLEEISAMRTIYDNLYICDGPFGTANSSSESGQFDFKKSNILTITLPASIKRLNSEVFMGCDKLESIVFLGTKEQWKSIVKLPEQVFIVDKLINQPNIPFICGLTGNLYTSVDVQYTPATYVQCSDGQVTL